MPQGIILSSSSQGATPEAVAKVLTDHGYEVDKPETTEPPATPVEPKREDFKTDEEFATAQSEFETAQEKADQAREEKEEKEAREREAREQHSRPSRRQRAVDKATKKLQDDLKAANDRIAALEGKKPAAEELKLEAPKREKFKTDQEFDDAMFDYRYQLRRQKEQVQEAQKSFEARIKQNYAEYQTEVAAFKEEHDDWDDVVGTDLPIPEPVYYAIVDLGTDGARVTYHLAKTPAALDKFKGMTPNQMVMETGRLADKLKAGPASGSEKPKKPAPKLPPPVDTVRTSATASTLTSKEAAAKRDFKAFKVAQARGV